MKKIFLIDDDIDDREMFRAAIKTIDPDIDYVEAQDGQEGFEMLSSPDFKLPDLIFVDLNMPRVTGLEFVVKIKQIYRYMKIPVYIYTTSASPRERVNCMTAGATGYIIKQLRAKDLADELRPFISKIHISA